MSTPRRLASRLLHEVARHSSSDSRDWANAMVRELDFIKSDWAALLWALGSTSAIFNIPFPVDCVPGLASARTRRKGRC